MSSLAPLEYTLAVSQVFKPCSYAVLRSGRALNRKSQNKLQECTEGSASSAYFLFANNPWERPRVAKAHTAKDWHRDTETAVSKLTIFAFGLLQTLLEFER